MAPPPFEILSHKQKWLQYTIYMGTLERAAWNAVEECIQKEKTTIKKIDDMKRSGRKLEAEQTQAVRDRKQTVFQEKRQAVLKLRQDIKAEKRHLNELKRQTAEADAAHRATLPPVDIRQSVGYARFIGY